MLRLNEAIKQAKNEIERIQLVATQKYGEEKGAIFSAHLLVLQDPELITAIKEKIEGGVNAEYALDETAQFFIHMFEAMNNDYMQERAPSVFEELGKTFRDIGYFKEQFHVSVLRLDMGFSGQEEAFMSLDASNVKKELK